MPAVLDATTRAKPFEMRGDLLLALHMESVGQKLAAPLPYGRLGVSADGQITVAHLFHLRFT